MCDNYVLMTFENMTKALICEEILSDFNVRTIPTPSFISNSCGLSIKIQMEYKDKLLYFLDSKKIEYKNIYIINNKNFQLLKGR